MGRQGYGYGYGYSYETITILGDPILVGPISGPPGARASFGGRPSSGPPVRGGGGFSIGAPYVLVHPILGPPIVGEPVYWWGEVMVRVVVVVRNPRIGLPQYRGPQVPQWGLGFGLWRRVPLPYP